MSGFMVLVEVKDESTNAWNETQFFGVPANDFVKNLCDDMERLYKAHCTHFEIDQLSGIQYFYFKNNAAEMRCHRA